MVSKKYVWAIVLMTALVFLVWGAAAADAQVAWQKALGNPGNDALKGFEKVASGYYLFGSTNATDGSATYLIQIDGEGKELSNKTINLKGQDTALDLEPLKDGMVLLVKGELVQPGQTDIGLLKLDSAGKTIWKRTFDMPGYTSACKVIRTSDNGYLIVGNTTNQKTGTDIFVVKTDVEGNPVWTRTYPGDKNDNPRGAISLDDGGFVIVGSTESIDPLLAKGLEDIFIMKITGDGTKVWEHTYGMSGSDRAYDVVQTVDRGFAIIGSTTDQKTGNQTIALFRTDSGGGNKLLEKHYGGPQILSLGSQIRKSTSGGFLISGITSVNNTSAMTLFETDLAGKVAWEKQIPLKQRESGQRNRDYFIPSGTGYLLAGQDFGEGANATFDYVVAKIMPPGAAPVTVMEPAALNATTVTKPLAANATVNTT